MALGAGCRWHTYIEFASFVSSLAFSVEVLTEARWGAREEDRTAGLPGSGEEMYVYCSG